MVGGLEEWVRMSTIPTEEATWALAPPEDAITLQAGQSQPDGKSDSSAEMPSYSEGIHPHLSTEEEEQPKNETAYYREVIVMSNQVSVIVSNEDVLARIVERMEDH